MTSLLVQIGAVCAGYQDKSLRNLPGKHIQCDEIWAFCYAKDKNLPENKKELFGYGSVWTWTALDADTKLICSWMVGNRDALAAREFIQDLAGRLSHRIQLTTDGHKAYLEAVDEAFGSDIDYAMLVKLYGSTNWDRLATALLPVWEPERRGLREVPIKSTSAPAMSSARI